MAPEMARRAARQSPRGAHFAPEDCPRTPVLRWRHFGRPEGARLLLDRPRPESHELGEEPPQSCASRWAHAKGVFALLEAQGAQLESSTLAERRPLWSRKRTGDKFGRRKGRQTRQTRATLK